MEKQKNEREKKMKNFQSYKGKYIVEKPVENVDKFRKMSKIKGWRAVRLWISLWTVWMKRSVAHRLKMQEAAFFPEPVCSRKRHTR